MSGIYIHIPFCKQACHYCDFHFSTLLKYRPAFLKALENEIRLQKNFFSANVPIDTIYFGGGTPSLLSADELNKIFDLIDKQFSIADNAEITLEANPDDLNEEKIKAFSETSINRLSIGIQSFFDEDLKIMNRAHVAEDGIQSVKRAQDHGFDNITIDLIYGLPSLSSERWLQNLHQAFELDVPHISCYHLTVEKKTALHHKVKKGDIKLPDEQQSTEQFSLLLEEMEKNKFIQYEISNFCKEGFYSRHNSSYWKGEHYLGLGPSAHSYNGNVRQWNIANNNRYISSLQAGKLLFEKEELTADQKYNEYIMVSLRTMWGTDMQYVANCFGEKYRDLCLKESQPYLQAEMLISEKNKLFLTAKGKIIADKISSDLFC